MSPASREVQRQRESASRIASLTLVNAMVFQEVLSTHEGQVEPLRKTLQSSDLVSAFADHWYFIITQINYHPIFHVARELLIALPSNPDVENGVRSLAQAALDIVRQRAALRHDLMGRVYHRLLTEAKHLGTYYTSVPAATLLLKLALDPSRWPTQWRDVGDLSTFRVADLACGTGTLLMAAAEAITDNYLRGCGEQRKAPDLQTLSRLLMQDVIYGYDVLASALHLTASTLALRAPDISFRLTHLYPLPLGGPHHRLGSIEFFTNVNVSITVDLFGGAHAPSQVTATGQPGRNHAPIPNLDLCVMNPPFTRSVGGNLLFGSVPAPERAHMQKELRKLMQHPLMHASSTAGLGSVFTAVGDRHLKIGGRIALVLPKALLSGVAWAKTRQLFRLCYDLEYLIVSHDPDRWNFSENTDLSEVLVVARKAATVGQRATHRPTQQRVVCLNLWKNPTTSVEALTIAYAVTGGDPPDLEHGQGALPITLGDTRLGEAVSVPWAALRHGSWMLPCAFAQSDLVRAAHHLTRGALYLPGIGPVGNLSLCPLKHLGSLGPDRRDIHDGFRPVKGKTPHPAFWSHDASKVSTLAQAPNKYLSPLHKAKPGRPLRRATDLWPRAGTLLLAERLRLNTQRLAAIRLPHNVLSNVWWPFALVSGDTEAEKALTLWLNSTLGLLILLAHREETQGAWIQFKKPVLAAMPVLDVRQLASDQQQALADAYDQLCQEPLLPFPHMDHDPTRHAIDQAIAQTLNLPDLRPLPDMLAREPVVCLQPLS